MNRFDFKFSDLPLIVDGPFEDSGTEGRAVISYSRDGDWGIDAIGIDVARYDHSSSSRERKSHWLDAGTPLYTIIYDRLEHYKNYPASIQEAAREHLEEDRVCAADDYADYRRDLRMEDAR
jgi:hypothetical protein